MTLHWWMHWFWVTLLIIIASSGADSAPQYEEIQSTTTLASVRQGRAMYYHKTTAKTTQVFSENDTEIDLHVIPRQNNQTDKPTEVQSIDWAPIDTTEEVMSTTILSTNLTFYNATVNNTEVPENSTFSKRRNLTRPDFVKEDSIEGVSESRIVTEKPLSLETAVLQTRIPPLESYRRVEDGGLDTGAIAGISFAALVLVALAGSTAFVLYRRRYLNKPQTLNDKCSNPDSSGYLDDSTIRDNSEEMYSLDNDSFLNSLEAMTIQNYWTDTVKHTKL